MKLIKLMFAVLALSLIAAACGDDSESEFGLVNEGTLTVCTDAPYPPMEYEDPDSPFGFAGFDMDLSAAIAEDLGLDIQVVTPGWDAITSGLAMETGQCDISAASITITAEREENIDFTDAYFEAEQSLYVLEATGGSSADDIGKIAVQSGTTGELYAQENLSNELVSFEDAAGPYLALQAGDVDGVITDLVGNQGYADDNPGIGMVIDTYATDEEYGMAVKEEGSEALLEAVNESLIKLINDGTYDEIFDEYFSA